jgi:hypothetical protein
MITILHGEDTSSSRNYLYELKQRSPEAPVIAGESIVLTDFVQTFGGGDLFVTETTVFIENLLSKRKQAAEFDSLIDVLRENTLTSTIILWEGKELDKKSLSLFPHATVKNHSLPKTLFLFLDSLKPNNGKQLVQLFAKTRATSETEMIFYLLVKQIRLLLAMKHPGTEKIDEIKRLAPWQLEKLQRQSKLFSSAQLLSLHTQLYELDNGVKTGELVIPLSSAIDILLLEI